MFLTLTSAEAEQVAAKVREYDETATAYTDYSGRGMYGTECFGIVTTNINLVLPAMVAVLTDEGKDFDVFELAQELRTDNMGLSFIAYFPAVQVKGN